SSANNSLIDCFYRVITVNLRVNLRIGAREGFPSSGLGIFLDKRVSFAGGAKRRRYGGDCGCRFADSHRRQRRGALLECGMGWGNAGVGTLAVGFVS
ncbi:hypothetical protein K5M56_29905, partial [Serratia marcescens]|nr:hypothetical protein [Serratia marcescens]